MATTLGHMGAPTAACPLCASPITDTAMCYQCADVAANDLHVALILAQQLPPRLARQRTNWNTGTTARSAEAPLPFDERASMLQTRLWGLTNLAMKVIESPYGHQEALGLLLQESPKALATSEHGPEFAREAWRLARDLEAFLNPPPDRRYLGPCDLSRVACTADLYVTEDDSGQPVSLNIQCPHCGRMVDVYARREELLTGALDRIASLREVTRLLRFYGGKRAVSYDTLRGLARHGRVSPVGQVLEMDKSGAARRVAAFRVGDVIDALDRTKRVQRAKKA